MVVSRALARAAVAEFGIDLPAADVTRIVAEYVAGLPDRGAEVTPVEAMRCIRVLVHLALRDPRVALPVPA